MARETVEEQRYEMVKDDPKGEHPPDYMRSLTLKEIHRYYFNWHTEDTHATEKQVRDWYMSFRGWTWVEI